MNIKIIIETSLKHKLNTNPANQERNFKNEFKSFLMQKRGEGWERNNARRNYKIR